MYVVTKDGQKLLIDDNSVDWNTFTPFHDTVGLYTEETVLRKVYILTLEKVNDWASHSYGRQYELEFVKELPYDHYPSQEEILWAMSAYGLNRHDIASVREAYELDMD